MDHLLWLNAVLDSLSRSGEQGHAVFCILTARRIRVDFQRQHATAARWTLRGDIQLNPHYYSLQTPVDDPGLLGLLVHEARHLQQGWLVALSVYGELEAWQAGYRFYHGLTGHYPHPLLAEICALPLNWNRNVLARARRLMLVCARRGYHADWLPLYPLPQEICYRVTGKAPAGK